MSISALPPENGHVQCNYGCSLWARGLKCDRHAEQGHEPSGIEIALDDVWTRTAATVATIFDHPDVSSSWWKIIKPRSVASQNGSLCTAVGQPGEKQIEEVLGVGRRPFGPRVRPIRAPE
jgi:hypothetical protein